jgi:6-pyruvoyltetrahydropterin/6-carboxytetrahydropterin synthase
MYTISKEFSFDASHSLEGLPMGHPCTRLHGHTYTVIVELTAPELDEVGFVLDYRELKLIKTFIDEHLDHRHLNDIVDFNPTAENLALYLFNRFAGLDFVPIGKYISAVTVKETPKTAATWRPKL